MTYAAIFALGTRGKAPSHFPEPPRMYTHPDRPELDEQEEKSGSDPNAIKSFFGL